MNEIYFDNAATTKVDKIVLESMIPYFNSNYGNPSNNHGKGIESKKAVENSRKIIADSINADIDEIYFTSGGTESNNLALKGLFFENYPNKDHIITTKIEHDSILNVCRWLEAQGAKITYLDVDKEGFINLEELKRAITDKTILLSVIHGNNEVGTIQDLNSIGKICKEKNILFHSDCCQSFIKSKIDVKDFNLDLVSLNSHKIHGPKGVGALFIKKKVRLEPLFHGGGHEKRIRSGTENVPCIVGFAKAVEISSKEDILKMNYLRDKLINGLLDIEKTELNGPKEDNRLCNNVNICFKNIEGESIMGYLEQKGIFVSTGSACSSMSLEPSHVLLALKKTPLQANSSIRISISKYTTEYDVDFFIKELKEIVIKLRKLSPLV